MKDLIKADVQRLTPDQLVGKAGHIVDSMTGNASFPTPDPKLSDVTAAQTTLVQAIEDAKSFSRPSIVAKKVAAEVLRDLLANLAAYVNLTAGEDLNAAVSSGYEQAKTPSPIIVEAPTALVARTSTEFGAIDLSWPRVEGVRMYFVYMTECKLPQDQVRGIVETHNTPELWDNEKEQMDRGADRRDAARA